MKSTAYLFTLIFVLLLSSCGSEDDTAMLVAGHWRQAQVFVDDQAQSIDGAQANTSLFMEPGGIYRLYDGTTGTTHAGTWLVSDGDWLNMSLDKIQGVNSDGTYRFGQYLVRFTILKVDNRELELRIRTYLRERKHTVMFNLIGRDNTDGMTGEELLELDTKNKEQHTYRYIFTKVNS